MNLKDVIHLYLGGKVEVQEDWASAGNIISHRKGAKLNIDPYLIALLHEQGCTLKVMPLLRQLKDMKYSENAVVFEIMPQSHSIPKYIHYLLSRGFDIFGLIESGQAIDSKTSKQYGIQ